MTQREEVPYTVVSSVPQDPWQSDIVARIVFDAPVNMLSGDVLVSESHFNLDGSYQVDHVWIERHT